MLVQFIHERTDVVLLEVLEAPLQDATAVGMCCELIYVALERTDESQPLRYHTFYELLNDLDSAT